MRLGSDRSPRLPTVLVEVEANAAGVGLSRSALQMLGRAYSAASHALERGSELELCRELASQHSEAWQTPPSRPWRKSNAGTAHEEGDPCTRSSKRAESSIG